MTNNDIKIVEWNQQLDLHNFYREAGRRGFVNNSNQKIMIDCFRNEAEWNAWILYKGKKPIGSVVAHSFDNLMGPASYRILARTCILEGVRSRGLMVAKTAIKQHQNMTDQFLLPQCLEWVNGRGRVFATSNQSKEASQKLVHNYYFPILESIGVVEKRLSKVLYRNTEQTVWEIIPDRFFESLNRYPRWK